MGTGPPRIAVIGSANVDVVTFADRVPRSGETIFGTQVHLGWGGKGANQAVAARRCGAEVDMVARVGEDLFGPATIENFKAHGIGTEHVRLLPHRSSGVASIFVEPNGQNRIIVVKGANDCLSPADVDDALPVLERADCIILQLEIPIETVYHAIHVARRVGARCILNPAPGRALDMTIVAVADYLIPNESEAETISGMPVHTLTDAEACARHLVGHGFQRVIITLGEQGALLASGEGSAVLPGFAVQTKDSTGAGDAFIGSFAVFRSEGVDEREAISRANLYAALSTTVVGTQTSFVSRRQWDDEWKMRRVAS